MPIFAEIYQQLNPAQKKAVDTIDGPVMVLAGPGTGKTQVLAARVANILLKTDVNPSNVLALTFTESAAANMRNRVVGMIGAAGYQVEISTFHSFCNLIITSYPEYFPLARGSQALIDVERFIVFEDILTELDLDVLKPLNDPQYYIQPLMKTITDLKRENVSIAQLEELVDLEKTELDEMTAKTAKDRQVRLIAKHTELIQVYQAYQAKLQELRRFDFEDMVSLVVQAFEKEPTLLSEYQEKYQYVLVDEYQDTNTAQNRVVQLLSEYWGEDANIFVVGDPQQSIFRFQGASLENVRSFMRHFPKAEVITLQTGYRCSQVLYDTVFAFITGQETEVEESLVPLLPRQPLTSISGVGKPIQILEVPSSALELTVIAEQIRKLLDEGVPTADLAVLYRTNVESLALMEAFDVFGIPYDVEGGGNVLDLEPIRQFLKLLQVLTDLRDRSDETGLFEVLCYPWMGVPSVTVMQLSRQAHQHKQGMLEYIESKHDGQTALPAAEILACVTKLQHWGTQDFANTLPEFFVQVLEESGFLSWVKEQPNKVQLLLGLQALFDHAKALARARRGLKTAEFLHSLAVLELAGQTVTARDEAIEGNGVKLFTVHKAKGQEWRYVFIVGLVDGRWGNRHHRDLLPLPSGVLENTPDKADQLAEERRLLYVAMTRAKEAVVLSYATTETAVGKSKTVVPSQFIVELKAAEGVVFDQTSPETTGDQLLESSLVSTGQPVKLESEERQYLQSLVEKMSLSVSTLNKYLQDPSAFLYETLLRVPSAKAPHMAFGTATHLALEALYRPLLLDKSYLSVDQVILLFQQALQRELLVDADIDRWQKKGVELLTNYHAHLPIERPRVLSLETNFGRAPYPTYLDDIHLTGKIDRLDWIDADKRTIRVIDYKTGKPRSLPDILATTNSSIEKLSPREFALPESIRGGYKRQLVFYQLLSQLATGFPGKVVSTRFEFVQPISTTSAPVIREVKIESEEVIELQKLIREVMVEIRSLDFLDHLEGW